MTTLAAAAAESVPRPSIRGPLDRSTVAARCEVVVVAVAFAVFALRVVPAVGGRQSGALGLGLATSAVAFLATQPWRRLRLPALLAVVAVCAAALSVCLVAPTAGAGLRDASMYVHGALVFAAVAAFARTPSRRAATIVALLLLGLDQMSRALLPWWGGEDPGRPMIGTLYWHNQFGAYMLAIGLAAGIAAIYAPRPVRYLAMGTAPVCFAAVVLSASRGAILVAAAGWLVVLALAVVQRSGRRGAVLRCLTVSALTAATLVLLTGRLLFASSAAPTTAIDRRNVDGAAAGSVDYRIRHNVAALAVFRERPLAGAGFESFRTAGSPHLPLGMTRSPFVHNGYLQAAADGGLLLALPFLGSLLAAGYALLRTARRQLRHSAGDWPVLASVIAAGGLLVHSAIDMDWSYPALGVLTSALLGVALARSVARPAAESRSSWLRWVAGGVILVLASAALVGTQRWESTARTLSRSKVDVATLAASPTFLGDARVPAEVLARSVPLDFAGRVTAGADVVDDAVRRTARAATVDGLLQMRRAQAYVALGQPALGLALSERVLSEQAARRPFLTGERAEILAAVGRRSEAVDLLVATIDRIGARGSRVGDQAWQLADTLLRLDDGSSERIRCVVTTLARNHKQPAISRHVDLPPPPSRPCG